jgi:hypothetical protein
MDTFLKKNIKVNNNSVPRLNRPNTKNQMGSEVTDFMSKNGMRMLYAVLAILALSMLIYLILCMVRYYKKECYEKKSFTEYLFDFKSPDVCLIEEKPIPKKVADLQKPKETISILPIRRSDKEVFHIADQNYTYEQAKCKCASYGARLATKDEITDAYNNGAHWCTYGWAGSQNAFYPVQKCEWDELNQNLDRIVSKEEIERWNRTHYCGKPGINGGHFSNAEIKFGVNCYGEKPKGLSVKEKEAKCDEKNFCTLAQNYDASHKLESDTIVGFNDNQWDQNKD